MAGAAVVTIGVLFVCTGGICRSPMAVGVLRALVERAGLERTFEIEAAGTYDGHAGHPPALLATEAASRRGYDIAGLRARPLVAGDIAHFDNVLAMDRSNLAAIRGLAPRGFADRPQMLLKFAEPASSGDIAAPYGGTREDYERALDLIEAGCTGLLLALRASLDTAASGTPRFMSI